MRFIQNWFSKRNTGNGKRSGQAEKTVEEIIEKSGLRMQETDEYKEQERIRNLSPQTLIDELIDLEDMAENDA